MPPPATPSAEAREQRRLPRGARWGATRSARLAATVVDFGVDDPPASRLSACRPDVATAIGATLGGITNFTLGRAWIFRGHSGHVGGQAVALRRSSPAAGAALNTAGRAPRCTTARTCSTSWRARSSPSRSACCGTSRCSASSSSGRAGAHEAATLEVSERRTRSDQKVHLKTRGARAQERRAPRARGRAHRARPPGVRGHGRASSSTTPRAAPSPTSTATRSSTSSAASASTRSGTRTRRRRRDPAAGGARARRLVHERGARRARRAPRGARAGAGAASRAALLGRRRGRRERAAPREELHEEVRVRVVLGRLPRQDHGRAELDGLHVQGGARPDGRRLAPRARTPTATAVPIGSTYPSCGLGCVEVGRKQLKMAGAGAVAGVHRRADAGHGRQRHSARRLPARRPLGREGARRAPHRRRDDHRPRSHREVVGRAPLGRRPRHRDDRQGLRRRLPALGPAHARRDREREAVERRRAARRRATGATRSAPPRAPPRCARSKRSGSSTTRATSAPR